LLLSYGGAAPAQVFVAGLGGAAALSNGAAASAMPVSASNYDSKVGPAFNLEAGYHLNDWFSLQAGYIWNRNRIVSTEVNGAIYLQQKDTPSQHVLSGDLLLYFRPRSSAIRPYLSGGPAWLHVLAQDKPGLRVATGVDLAIRSRLAFRYCFSEVLSPNPIGAALHPPAGGKLMNFQNLFGVVKIF
jgi:hypothetical protein